MLSFGGFQCDKLTYSKQAAEKQGSWDKFHDSITASSQLATPERHQPNLT